MLLTRSVRIIVCCLSALVAITVGGSAQVVPRSEILAILDVTHSPQQPPSSVPISIRVQLTGIPSSIILEYQIVDPGRYVAFKDPAFKTNWVSVAMTAEKTAKGWYAVTLPGDLQKHRRLVRYRVRASDSQGNTKLAPAPDDTVPNFGYFVYDGIPAWRGAVEPKSNNPKRREPTLFDTNVMRSMQAFHLISKKTSVENVTWREPTGGNEYKYTGTVVSDGIVYDHVYFRARGGGWRYAMGKNMWKFDFAKGHHFRGRDNWGRSYQAKWSKINLGACIQQGDYGCRGEQGMFESVGFRLFNLAGVPSPNTHWVQLRIIDEAEEAPANQYQGDFWGLYLVMENEDGHFLKEHGLPDGNIYKMEGGSGTLSHHGEGASSNRLDLDKFLINYSVRQQPESWWRSNLNLSCYYSYRSIIECIHHYDVEGGKNYDYYLNPKTKQWTVLPWDIDLSWADHMYGGANEPFAYRVLTIPKLRIEYQNRLREIRDLLYNTDQAWKLIDEYAAVIAGASGGPTLAGADRARWDFHPVMAMGGKAGQGLFYQGAPSKDFAGMVKLMKDYVKHRSAWIDSALLNDRLAPPALTITNASPANFLSERLRFTCSSYKGTNAFKAMKWRLGEVSVAAPQSGARRPNIYEITPVWESAEQPSFTNTVTLPAGVAQPGHTYRVRVRVQDQNERWSHWSEPIEFTAGK